ncbi:SDR family oxidoreductase [Pseudomonas indica]|uniref:SDR family oxidoreductase n=1 Tax=Pseudomonas indica TaxID=137658 RepID=UPI0023F99993|nr:SDR family oxidoreductase [Pseudomonas indica]MBU3057141.1 SDR family oxidoreductase [Pseudomonas indica]
MTPNTLEDALIVITGASSGIGRAAALAFAERHARLVLAARDKTALDEVVAECEALGARALAVPTDVTDSEAVHRLADSAASFGDGRIDVWVNNAGIGTVGAFDETPLVAHEQVVQTDLLGYLRGAHAVLPYFKQQQAGVLINTLSLGSWVAHPYAAAYAAAKYGLRGFTEALRGELTQWPHIHICDVYPAVMDTPGFRDAGNYTGHNIQPIPPVYDPRRVAEAMVSLAQRPRRSVTVGASARLIRLAHFLVPHFESLIGRATHFALGKADRSPASSGNLFHPPLGERRVDGGWRSPPHGQLNLLLAGTAVAALLGFYLVRRATNGRH